MSATWRLQWKPFLTSSRNLKTAWFIAIGIAALYVGAIQPYEYERGIASSKAIGLAAVRNGRPMALWHQMRFLARPMPSRDEGILGGVAPVRNSQLQTASFLSLSPESPAMAPEDAGQKMVRTISMDLIVQRPSEVAEKIRAFAEHSGGFLVASETRGGEDASYGSVTIRVPVAEMEGVRAEIRKLGRRIESERVEAQDVTRQYVDQNANLRNLRAEEAQYLAILRQAKTVKDTLDVSEKLGEVRGQIEQRQAEFDALSKQIEMVAITVALHTEAEAQVFGLNWRPLYQIKLDLRDGLDGLANYVSSMVAFVFLLPTIALWLATIVVVCVLGWKLLRWIMRRWFGWGSAVMPVAES